MKDWFDAERRIERANQLSESHRWEEALAEIEAALEINPHNAAWHYARGTVLDQMDRYEDAIQAYRASLELEPDDSETMNALGVDLLRIGRFARALETFERVSELDPDFEPGYCNRIMAYAELGRHEKAEEMFYLAQQIDPDCPHCFYHIGVSLFARRECDRAVYCWRRALEIDPDYLSANQRIAEAYRLRGDVEQARKHYLAELRQDPGNIELIYDLGELLLESSHVAAAAEKFRHIIELFPSHASAHMMLGVVASREGRMDNAVKHLQEAERLDDTLPDLHQRLGEALMSQGHWGEAELYLKRAVEQTPEDIGALMLLGNCHLQMGKTKSGADVFRRILALDDSLPGPYHNLGVCFFLEGDQTRGIEYCQKALERNEDYVLAMHKLILAWLEMGQWGKARTMIRRALRVEPDNLAIRDIQARLWRYRLAALARRLLAPLQRLGFRREKRG